MGATVRTESIVLGVQTAAGAVTAAGIATGNLWLWLAAALVGSAAGLHMDDEEPVRDFLRTLLAILVVSAFALMVGALVFFLVSEMKPLLGLSPARVPGWLWAGIAGFFGKPIYRRLRREARDRKAPGG